MPSNKISYLKSYFARQCSFFNCFIELMCADIASFTIYLLWHSTVANCLILRLDLFRYKRLCTTLIVCGAEGIHLSQPYLANVLMSEDNPPSEMFLDITCVFSISGKLDVLGFPALHRI